MYMQYKAVYGRFQKNSDSRCLPAKYTLWQTLILTDVRGDDTAFGYCQSAEAVCGRLLTREVSGSIPREIHTTYVLENVALQQRFCVIASVLPCR
jgi:hypothetical protein